MSVTELHYLYRDGSNYKQYETIYVEGELSAEQAALIASKLDEGVYFIPADLLLGIPELQARATGFPNEDDHVYHELELESRVVSPSAPAGAQVLPLEALTAAFARISSPTGWNEAAAKVRLGL